MRIEDPNELKRFEEYLKTPDPLSEEAKKLFQQAWRMVHPEKFDPPV